MLAVMLRIMKTATGTNADRSNSVVVGIVGIGVVIFQNAEQLLVKF